jgi:hypothetical protein
MYWLLFPSVLQGAKKQCGSENESDLLQLVFVELLSVYHSVLLPEALEGSKNSVRAIVWTDHALE